MSGAVTFVTLFLNLMTGSYPVTVAVDGDVTRVEILLDGERVGLLTGPPWTVECDFGPDLEPHELVAVGRDSRGREIARAKQLINLPRPRAEARLLLESRKDGPPDRARLTWQTVENLSPQSIELRFDDQPLSFHDTRHIDLPPYDPGQPHFLSAKLTFEGELEARTITSFGGALGAVLDAELTALPIVSERSRKPPRSPGEMAGWFYDGTTALQVFTVEKEAADLFVVVDREAWKPLQELLDRRGRPNLGSGSMPVDGLPGGLRKKDRLRFVATVPQVLTDAEPPRRLFPIGPDINTEGKQALALVLAHATPPDDDQPQRIADAVAVAARTAVTGERPRAVLLILAEHSDDSSGVAARAVREYLHKIRVPFHLWRTYASEDPGPWGEGVEITKLSHLRPAIKALRRSLDRQYVVWLEGSHMPHQVELRHDDWRIAG